MTMRDASKARPVEEVSPMKQWVYKVNTSKVGYHETRDMAVTRHFLCRSAVEASGAHPDRVREVELGDIIHFFYALKNGKVPSYGSFTVIDGAAYPTQFGERIEGTALFKVRQSADNAELIQLLTEEHEKDPKRGYRRDPEHGCFTGWVIKRLASTEVKPPEFNQRKLFPGSMINLWPYPDPELPRPQAEPKRKRRSVIDNTTTKGGG
jgi:hypothetical protein